MGYEKFTAYGAGGRDQCTLRASGYLFIPRAMLQAIGHADPQTVVLYFDREAMKLAVLPPKAFELTAEVRETSVEPSGIAVNIVPVLRAYRLQKPEKRLMLEADIVEVDGRRGVEVDMSKVPRGKPEAPTRW